jgi:hypothetical protein
MITEMYLREDEVLVKCWLNNVRGQRWSMDTPCLRRWSSVWWPILYDLNSGIVLPQVGSFTMKRINCRWPLAADSFVTMCPASKDGLFKRSHCWWRCRIGRKSEINHCHDNSWASTMKHRRLGADVVRPEHQERHFIRPYCVSITLSDLKWCRSARWGTTRPRLKLKAQSPSDSTKEQYCALLKTLVL